MENSESKVVCKYDGHDIVEFTGKWQIVNKDLLVEVQYIFVHGSMYGVYKENITSFVNSDYIEINIVWPVQNCTRGDKNK